jgi:plastocyanin
MLRAGSYRSDVLGFEREEETANREEPMTSRKERCLRTALAVLAGLSFSLTTARATTWFVTMEHDARFHPATLTIVQGDSVNWQNVDTIPHTSTSGPPDCRPDQLWDSGDIAPGTNWGMRFTEVGSFPYFCTLHCSFGMTAVLNVEQETPNERETWGQIKKIYRR